MVFAVSQRCDHDPHQQCARPAVVLGKLFIEPQQQRGKKHQRPVRNGDESVQLQDRHGCGDQCEQSCFAAVGRSRSDDFPQDEQVQRLQQREQETNAQFPAQKTAQSDQQRGHRRMIEIAPCQGLRKHVIVGLVVGQFGASGLDQVDDPPSAEQKSQQRIRVFGNRYVFYAVVHTEPFRSSFVTGNVLPPANFSQM